MSASVNSVARFGKPAWGVIDNCQPMTDEQRLADIETLARIAARLAGRDSDEHVRVKVGSVVAFDGVVWRYPDFLARAEAAYDVLAGPVRPNS
jgi:hypothetical protein